MWPTSVTQPGRLIQTLLAGHVCELSILVKHANEHFIKMTSSNVSMNTLVFAYLMFCKFVCMLSYHRGRSNTESCHSHRKRSKSHVHCVSKKSSHLSTLCNFVNLNRFSKICTAEKPMKCATKFMRHYPPHLKHVATLPWEIKNSNFLQIFSRYEKCKQIAFLLLLTLLFIHKFWYFRCLR